MQMAISVKKTVEIQKFCYRGNVTLHFSFLFDETENLNPMSEFKTVRNKPKEAVHPESYLIKINCIFLKKRLFIRLLLDSQKA